MHLSPNSSRAALHTTTPSLPPKTPPPKDPACCTHTQAARSLSGAGLSLPRVMCPRLLVWPHRLIAPHAGCAASQHGVHPPSSCQVLSLHAARAGIGQERGCCVAEARAPAANPKPGAASLRGGRVRALQRAAATATATAVATAMGSSPLFLEQFIAFRDLQALASAACLSQTKEIPSNFLQLHIKRTAVPSPR